MGIEVAKARLDIAIRPSGQQWVTAPDEAGLDALVQRLQVLAPAPALVVLEATGGREVPVAAALATALATVGLPVAVVNPRQVRDFARAIGHLAKTDALDAAVLARFAEVVRPAARPLPDAQTQELAALLARRRHLLGMLARRRHLLGMLSAERQRLDTALAGVPPHIQRHIAWLEHELADLDRTWRERVQASPLWREHEQLLRSVPGGGPTTALTWLAELAEWGRLERKAIAALLGVAPLNGESATLRGRRIVWGGRARVRTVLYMATLVATRHNPLIRACYTRWCAAAKPTKVALTACMHKLLLILNAVVPQSTSWRAPAVS